jgi:proteasome lid subunit RPN8/RPN11
LLVELIIRKTDIEQIVNHCRSCLPDEACGILAGRNGSVEKVYPMANVRPGPASYEMDPEEQFRVLKDIRQAGRAMVGIYHSHPGGPACPSGIDVERAYWPGTLFPNYPGAVHVIVSLRDRRRPEVRGYSIDEGRTAEVALQVV